MNIIQLIYPAIISAAVLLVATPAVIRFARNTGYIAHPKADRWHTKPTALLGGIAIFIGIITGFIVIQDGVTPQFLGIVAGASVMFFGGLIDDIRGVRPYTKVVFQIAAASLVILSGIVMGKSFLPPYISVPLTFLWIVGITNAVNLLDNMDGLSAGVTAIASIFLGVYFVMVANPVAASLAFVLAGTTIGFLVFNFYPAKIFMGDCGSLILGFMLASLALIGSLEAKSHIILSIGIPVLTMSLPIFDTVLVTINRKYVNRPISQGGTDHSSHRLIALGYSEPQAALILYGITAIGGLAALGIYMMEIGETVSIIILSVIIFIGGGAFFTRVKVYTPNEYDSTLRKNGEKGLTTPIRTVLQYKRRIAEVAFDTLAIMYSLYGAILLQNGGSIPSQVSQQAYSIMPLLAPGGVILFFAFRFYKDIWRYISIDDLNKYAGAVIVLTIILSISKITIPLETIGFTTLIIFAQLLFLLITGFRLSERIIGSILKQRGQKNRGSATRVIMVGAGDTGNLAVREILQNDKLNMVPVGFVDDDPSKHGSIIQGCKVLGNVHRIERYTRQYNIDEIIITISDIDQQNLERIIESCQETGLPVKRGHIKFDDNIYNEVPVEPKMEMVAEYN